MEPGETVGSLEKGTGAAVTFREGICRPPVVRRKHLHAVEKVFVPKVSSYRK